MKQFATIAAAVGIAAVATISALAAHEPTEAHVAEHGVGRAESAPETAWAQITSEVVYSPYSPVEYKAPEYGDRRAVTVACTDDELEELARLAYLEAGADWISDDCIRAVVEVVFNQLAYGAWGDTLHEVINFVHPDGTRNYEPAAKIPYTEPSARCREIVRDVYENGCRLPARVMFFRACYYHAWDGAVAEFEIDGVYFSSSRWASWQ